VCTAKLHTQHVTAGSSSSSSSSSDSRIVFVCRHCSWSSASTPATAPGFKPLMLTMLALDFETGTQAAVKSARASLLADPLGTGLRTAIEKSAPPWQPQDVDERVRPPPHTVT
jgi:hypothetical protein